MKNVVQKIFLSDFSIRCKPWKTLARLILLTMGVMIDIGCPSPESSKHYFRESNFKVTFYQIAIYMGIQHRAGERIGIFDANGHHPPELFPKSFQECINGVEAIYAFRAKRKETLWKRMEYRSSKDNPRA